MNHTTFKSPLQVLAEGFFLLLTGGVLYYGIEVLYRGYSHWTMALCGALCFLGIDRINRCLSRKPLPLRALVGALMITCAELFLGCVLNLWLGMGIWDYSNLPLHFMGQICLPFSLLWFLLCFPACLLCRLVRRRVFLENV